VSEERAAAGEFIDTSLADEAAAAVPPVSLGRRFRSVCSACRQIFGMPDYDRYLAHAAATHPGAPVLSRRDYFAQMIERRYGKNPGRCC
jgi:uncharacterized short protein YbdD (DUF466 family)